VGERKGQDEVCGGEVRRSLVDRVNDVGNQSEVTLGKESDRGWN
jgi:hypothetical protein